LIRHKTYKKFYIETYIDTGKVCMEGTRIFVARDLWATGGGLGYVGRGYRVGQRSGETGDGSAWAGRTATGRPKEPAKKNDSTWEALVGI